MEIKRTANAGVLIYLDGVSILLDGVCGEILPYLKTPDDIKQQLCEKLPDVVGFTHKHLDHYDEEFAVLFEKTAQKKILSPFNQEKKQVGNVVVESFKSRHIGKSDIEHVSFIINGSKVLWFMGDASPLTIKQIGKFSKPDVLLVPFAYVNSESSLKLTKSTGAEHIVVLHLPLKDRDEYKIFESFENLIIDEKNIHTINLGETLNLY